MDEEDTALREAADRAEEVSDTKTLDVAARFGFAVMAVLHIIIGAIAISLAFGGSGQAEPTGAIAELAASPWGPAVLWACAAGCVGLALWQLSEATLRARHLPTGERLGKTVTSGFLAVAYGSIGLTFGNFALGVRSDSGDSTRDFTVALMRAPLGSAALLGLGAVIAGIGVYFEVKGLRRTFREELAHFEQQRRGRIIEAFGVVGHVAKGVALNLVGLLFIVAVVKQDPQESTGLDGSLKALRDQAYGPYLLLAIGAGFICYGVFALLRSRFGRM